MRRRHETYLKASGPRFAKCGVTALHSTTRLGSQGSPCTHDPYLMILWLRVSWHTTRTPERCREKIHRTRLDLRAHVEAQLDRARFRRIRAGEQRDLARGTAVPLEARSREPRAGTGGAFAKRQHEREVIARERSSPERDRAGERDRRTACAQRARVAGRDAEVYVLDDEAVSDVDAPADRRGLKRRPGPRATAEGEREGEREREGAHHPRHATVIVPVIVL